MYRNLKEQLIFSAMELLAQNMNVLLFVCDT